MDISVKHQEMTTALANVIVLGIFEDDKSLSPAQKKVDTALDGLITNDLIKNEGDTVLQMKEEASEWEKDIK